MSLTVNLEHVRGRMAQACRRSGRSPSSVTLIAVTKALHPETVREIIGLGLTDLGESRVQEARAKQAALGSRQQARGSGSQLPAPSPQPVRWHLIGHLQRNKAKPAVECFDVVHSVDSLALVDALEEAASSTRREAARQLEVLIQVNVSGESTKFGCRSEDAVGLARAIGRSSGLALSGLMTLAPFGEDPEQARPHFRRLRELRDALAAALGRPAKSLRLSMGMSQDFEVAVEEGADFVRIGTAIFGERHAQGRGA